MRRNWQTPEFGRRCAALVITLLIVEHWSPNGIAQPARGPARERFVPADQMDAIFERSPNGVMLQRDKFEELLNRAHRAEAEQAATPEAIIIRGAAYDVKQAGRHAIVELTIDIEQFVDRWAAINIPVGNLLVEDATIEGETAAISYAKTKPDQLTLVHRDTGRFQLLLTLSTPLTRVGSGQLAAFRILPHSISTVTVACPKQRHLEVNNLQLTRPTSTDEVANYSFPAGNLNDIKLNWTARQQKAETDTLVFARTSAQLLLGSNTARWNSTTRVSVFGNTINQLAARIPATLEITSVESAGLKEWKLEDDKQEGFTRLLLNYRQPFSADRILKISAVSALQENETSSVPTLEFIEVTAHNGRLNIQHEDQLRLMATVSSGIRHVGTNVDSPRTPSGEIFDFWIQDFDLDVAIKPRNRELFAEINSTLSIVDTAATFVCDATIETLNAPLFELPIQMPENWQLAEVADAKGLPVKWREGSEKGQIVIEPATAIATNELLNIKLRFTNSISDPTNEQTLSLPVITALDTLQVGGTYQISASDDLTVAPVEVSGLSPIGDSSGTLLFETQGTTFSGILSITRKPSRMATRSVLKSWMDARQRTVVANITIDVVHGTTRSLQLELPEELGEEIRFEIVSIGEVIGFPNQRIPNGLRIVEQSATSVADGVRTFDLTFDKRFQGALTLKAKAQFDRGDDNQLPAPFLRVVGAIRQHGLVSFEAYPDQQLKPTADEAAFGLEKTDSGLINPPDANSGRRTALVYRYTQPQYSLSISESRYVTEAVPSAVCEKIANISVLSETGTTQRSCCVHFQCSGVQTLRFALADADQSYLWSTILNGKAVEVRRDGNDYLVAIPTNHNGSGHILEVLFESTSAATNVLGERTQQSLSLSIDTEHDQASPIDVLEQTWEVRYPSSAVLLDHDGGFQPQKRLEQSGWLQHITSLFSMPSWKTARQRMLLIGAFAIALLATTKLILRRRWKSLLAFGAVCIFLGPLILGYAFLPQATSPSDYYTDGAESSSAPVSGGTKMVFEGPENSEARTEELQDMPPAIQGGGGFPRDTTPNGAGGGGFHGGLQERQLGETAEQPTAIPPERTSGQANPLFDEVNRLPTPSDDFAGQAIGLASPEALRSWPGIQSHTMRNFAPNQRPETGLLPNANVVFDVDGDSLTFPTSRPAKPGGAARLSIRANVAAPSDYQSTRFRSINGTQGSSTLKLVVQERSRVTALRIIAAAIVLLMCLLARSLSTSKKLSLVIILGLAALAAVPLVPNPWQSAVDGVFIGTLAGISLWGLKAVCCISKCFGCCGIKCCSGLFRSKAGTAIVMLVTSYFAASPQTVAAPQETPKTTARPDIVLPYSADQPKLLADRVFLPQDEFLKLYKQAYPESLKPQKSPVAAGVVAAFYKSGDRNRVRDDQWTQTFSVRYVIRSFRDDAIVALPIRNIAIRSAKLNKADAILQTKAAVAVPLLPSKNSLTQQQAEQQAALVQTQQQLQQLAAADSTTTSPQYSVRVPSAGLNLLDVAFEVSATIEGPTGRVQVSLEPVAVGTMKFEVPDEQTEATVNGRSNVFRREGNILTIPIAMANHTRIEWHPKNTQSSSDTVFHSEVRSALDITDAGLTVNSSADLSVRQGQLSEISVSVPSGYLVQKVDGSNIASWSISDEKPNTLKIVFQQAIESTAGINLTLFSRQIFDNSEKVVDVPIPVIAGASRDFGQVTVLAGREVEVRVNSLSGVRQLNAAESALPHGIAKSARRVLAWRYTRHPAAISVRVFRAADRLIVRSLNGVQLETQRQLWTTLLQATISGAPRRRLEVVIPKDFLALEVTGNNLTDWYYTENETTPDKTKILNLQFVKAQTGHVSVVVQGQRDRTGDTEQTTLRIPEVLSADKSSTTALSVWLDAASTIRNVTAEGWNRNSGHPSVLALKSETPDISFSATGNSLNPVSLTMDEVEAAFVTESVSVTNVTDTSVELTLGLNWDISGDAAVRKVAFALPSAFGDVYDFRIPGLRQLEKRIEDEWIIYTIHLQQPVANRFFVLGTGTLPLPGSNQILAQPPQFRVAETSKSSITNQSHFWVVVNQSSGLLESVDSATDGENISEDDIKINIPEALLQQAVAIRRLKTGQQNSAWQLKFPERQQVTPAVIALAAHTTIIAGDGTWRSRHALQVRNESRQFLPVVIPANSRFLYCLVEGKPTRIVSRNHNESALRLIPIPQSGELATPFEIEFALSGFIAAPSGQPLSRRLAVPVPVFLDYRDDPEFGITVSRNTWSVYVPDEWQANILNDPRNSNVIPATEDDFEDAAVLSAVDNMKSIINSLSVSSEEIPSVIFFSGIAKQRSLLQSQRGNTPTAEDERQQTLEQLDEVLSQSNVSGGYGGGEVLIDMNRVIADGLNRYLDFNDAAQNKFNFSNSMDFIAGNGGVGIPIEALSESSPKFGFALPQVETAPANAPAISGGKKSKTNVDAPSKTEATTAVPQHSPQTRSLLLKRRSKNRESQLQKAKKKSADTADDNLRFSTREADAPAPPLASSEFLRLEGNQYGEEIQTNGNDNAEGVPRAAAGQLSLNFRIPDGGTRHDFVRTGGNATLTLNVRETRSFHTGLSIVWAVICGVVALLLTLATSKETNTFLKRTLILMALAGLTGWLFLPTPLHWLSLFICITVLAITSLCAIVQGFRKPRTA